jgi:prenyltransferase beta subunit
LGRTFGHGEKHLSNTLAAINILALLTHTEQHYRLTVSRRKPCAQTTIQKNQLCNGAKIRIAAAS